MYEYFEGVITIKNLNYVVIDINGVGYKIYTSIKTYDKLNSIGKKDKLFIHTIVKEDDISFFGFKDELERSIFLECIAINGIGAKKAIAILSNFEFEELAAIASSKNFKELAKVPGIGMKKAEKIMVDLSDKLEGLRISKTATSQEMLEMYNKKENLKLALESLGYEKVNVSNLIEDSMIKELNMQELIKLALLNINKKKK
ncbi:Holliday junction branch migration protein RuvA [Streptobacillus felis]|uniref:Holliday junction branch migration complex subunit RuvA n=1 Tax=Streptobacillus felis TaxID=1384509 RepID=A0A7Z0PDU4_9FUSO|nr:Holliday junction branch migration protein RuvA [Streptobacillus felis]NYV27429.1 Holliday junction branch migration protein RuvA [Streptobacillus felis]